MTTTPPPSSSSTAASASGTTSRAGAGSRPSGAGRRRPARVSGEEREAAIVDTLRALLDDRPLRAVSVDDLATGAGISRPTFYFYFASKEAVLLTLLERLEQRITAATRATHLDLGPRPAEAWRTAIGAAFAMWTTERPVIAAAAEARAADPAVAALWDRVLAFFVEVTAEAIEAERHRGRAPDGPPAHDLSVCLNRMNERVFDAVLGGEPGRIAQDTTVDTLTQIWLRTIYGTDAPDHDGPPRTS